MPSASELYTAYKEQEPVYIAAADSIRSDIEESLTNSAVNFTLIESRHKRPLELFKKQRRKNYPDPWVDCPDLVGVRVVVPISSDKARVVAALQCSEAFDVEVEDQSVDAKAQELVYRGLHLHLGTNRLNKDGTPISCEVQVRTTAEHSWAATEHQYVYKKAERLPYEIQRTFRRLLVLVELYDQELSKGVDMVRKEPAHSEMALVTHLENLFEELSDHPGDQETTRETVEFIGAAYGYSADELRGVVDSYLEDHSEYVRHLLSEHGPDTAGFNVDADWITSQPELLLALALLEEDEYRLSNALFGAELYSYIEPVALWTNHSGFVQ